MKNTLTVLLLTICCFYLSSCGSTKSTTSQSSPDLNKLLSWMQGSFNSYQQSDQDSDYYNVSLEMHQIWPKSTDGAWLYVEQAMASQMDKPYRQRVYHLQTNEEGLLESVVYTLPDAEKYVGKWNDTALFNRLSPISLVLRGGCTITLQKEGNAFVGSTTGKNCGSQLRGASYATSKVNIYADRIESWDQGFDEGNQQVWGAEKGAYVFNKKQNIKMQYPPAKRGDVVDDYHGTPVADPYRWLEDENAAETKMWIGGQNKLTDTYLNNIPFKEKIRTKLEKWWNYPKYSAPRRKGTYFYYSKNNGLQNHSVIYRQKSLDAEPEVFLDPNQLSEDGKLSLTTKSFSKDNKYFVYGTSEGGSDWREFHIMETESKTLLSDHLKHIKFSGVAWYGDGFFYGRYDAPTKGKELSASNELRKIYYHKIGQAQSNDKLVYMDEEHPKRGFYMSTTDDQKILVMYASEGASSGNSLHYMPTKDWENEEFRPIIEDFESNIDVIDHESGKLLVHTNRNAPKYRLVAIDLANPAEENWEELIPEQADVLRSVHLVGGKVVGHYLKDVSSRLYVFDENWEKTEIKLPTLGIVNSFAGKKTDSLAFFKFASYLYPPTIFQYNINKDSSIIFQQPDIDFDFSAYETKQVFYESKDGTKIPMFITQKKGTPLNGQNPTFLYAYGGFNVSRIPEFRIDNLPFYESGGIYAVANIRGGSEYGEEWHRAGMLEKKQNVFDDFIAAAEYLIAEKYTSSEKLAITGRSNGGLLIGAVINQRPDLFKAALPVVGVMDMLRYQKFTIGWAWASEYGSSEKPKQFEYLYKYSPYHNIQPQLEYPAVHILTAERDDRVVPAHSYKYAAELQHQYKGNNPILIRIEKDAGHGSGKTTSQSIEKYTERWSFVFYNLGMFPIDDKKTND